MSRYERRIEGVSEIISADLLIATPTQPEKPPISCIEFSHSNFFKYPTHSPPRNCCMPLPPPRPQPAAIGHSTRLFAPSGPVIHPTASLCIGDHQISAVELESRADQLAHDLQSMEVGPGCHIGIGLDRSPELLVALLAVVKSGAAYVPLDPELPPARLSQMIASADLRIILSRGDLAPRFKDVGTARLIELDDRPAASSPCSIAPFTSIGAPDAPIYAIFTSGSTGQPKAASILRRSLANLLDWYLAELALDARDRTLVITSPGFDLTQKNLFAPLITGGALILDDSPIFNLPRILQIIRDQQITILNCTPSAFDPLVEAASSRNYADLQSLRCVVLGGETISLPRLRKWLEHPACKADVLNTYGPTECADISTFHRLHRGNLDDFPAIPIGREIPNVTVTIRDEDLAPLEDGEIGELCIAGACLGAGYLGDPAKTRHAFALAHSLYRSGDLARRLPCGNLEFHGRTDQQVKVNGFRIELGEIEGALRHHPKVLDAVVLADQGRLIAHVVGDTATTELKEYLLDRLPAYMVPHHFRFRSSLPLTPNGKVNRLALMESGCHTLPQPAAASHASPEQRILTLWSEVLGQTIDDPDANFFDLGGTSIDLATIHARLRDPSGRELPITELFARPTASSLAGLFQPQASPPSTSAPDRAKLQRNAFSRFQRTR